MANNALLAALFGGGAKAIGGYQRAKQYNNELTKDRLMLALQQAQMMQGQQNWQQSFGQRKEEFEYGKQQDVATQDRWNRDKNWEAFKYTHEGAAKAMEPPKQLSLDNIKAALATQAGIDPRIIDSPLFRAMFPSSGKEPPDPNIAINRNLTQRKTIQDMLQGGIGRNRDREYGEYREAGGMVDNKGFPIANKPMLGTSWGREGRVNPAIKEQQDMDFWNWDNPAARDSAATLESIDPDLYQKHFGRQPEKAGYAPGWGVWAQGPTGGGQVAPPGVAQNQQKYQDATNWAASNITDWEQLDNTTKAKIIRKRMAEMGL